MESNSRYNEELFEKFLEIIAPNPHNKINLPEGIKNILFNEDYFKQYAKFEKSYSGSILTYGDITNFQNNYLREKHLLDSDEIKARSLTGKKITIKKDDFNHAFLSDNWGGLNFSQKYTILHWLQSTLSTKPNLPTIDFISTSPNNDGDASYFRNINAIYLKFSNLNSGLFIASALIHEMDHFNCLTNPDINKVIKISDNEINLKNYAMANGLPIGDPESGYNPNDPWAGREPRFYSDIIVDGDQMVVSAAGGNNRFAQLYNGGFHRATTGGSISGYYYKRFSPIGCNPWDKGWNNFQAYVPYLRLADVYLMYAEAVLQGYGSAASSSTVLSLTAESAVNRIRNRAQLPNLVSKYTATKEAFMGEIIRERAVELAYEAHRFCDLRRWNLNGEIEYREKTAIDFDRGIDGKPINLQERIIITRVVEKKHNWLPLPLSNTNLYPEFPQNPGW